MATPQDDYEYIGLEFLIPSPTNPRTTFTEEALDELAESIKQHGIIEPLIVRVLKKTNTFEIVCGHRRHRGALKAELAAAPCIIRDLTDEQVIDMQIHENLKREDLNPIDEAVTYQLMRDNGVTLAEIVARAGRSESYIQKRLQLINLIDKAKEDIKDGHLPMSIGVEMAKYPVDAQEEVYKKLYDVKWVHPETGEDFEDEDEDDYDPTEDDANYDDDGEYIGPDVDEDDEDETDEEAEEETEAVEPVGVYDKSAVKMTPNAIAQFVRNQFMLDLASAPFKLNATNLREDKLACTACPERTGANAGLFDTVAPDRDYCLNRFCFIAKRVTFIEITRKKVAKDKGIDAKDIPLVYADWHDERLIPENIAKVLGGITGDRKFTEIDPESEDEDDHACGYTVIGMDTKGVSALICLENTGCTQHHWSNRYAIRENGATPHPSESAEERAEKEAQKKRDRKEEIFDCKVAEIVRLEVISTVAKKFATIGLGALSDFTDAMTARLWQNVTYNTKNQFDLFCKASELELPEVRDAWNNSLVFEDAVKGLTQEQKAKLLIVLSHYWKGDCRSNQYVSQRGVKEVADYFSINYKLIDAQQRVELASKKNKKKFEAYLQQVEVNDPDAKKPRIWSEDYVSEDDPQPATAVEPVAVAEVEEAEPDDEIAEIEAEIDEIDEITAALDEMFSTSGN